MSIADTVWLTRKMVLLFTTTAEADKEVPERGGRSWETLLDDSLGNYRRLSCNTFLGLLLDAALETSADHSGKITRQCPGVC